ncbi:DUF4214 domain-containing protein [Paenibacillus thiaminolyticus]|uniref:DUF4214 domain-containing protein n=1 Tax=Paenibacillus thiaminolyticus TaxID=49283 RepID=UPI002543E43A|nr:DUF4214 domain-containing protein [Paenibacillus thiaminolyticus]WII36428.1 DUF4214 domain-containing protein [Paenibacillus thiaminolyticus]
MSRHYRIIHHFYELMRREGKDFVRHMYIQMLHREPGEAELHHYVSLLSLRTDKSWIAMSVLCSEEAEQLYHRPAITLIPQQQGTIASRVHSFYTAEPLFFLHSLYAELLGRVPDPAGMEGHSRTLSSGASRKTLLSAFVKSEECQRLLSGPNLPPLPLQPHPAAAGWGRNSPVTQIGIFLGYPHPLALDGEGIGRFLYRLIEGLLTIRHDTVIHIAATHYNEADTRNIFNGLNARFPGRCQVVGSNNIGWINDHVPVDIWIVPIVSLDLALYLKKPYILCLHDLVHHQLPELYSAYQSEFCNRVNRTAYYVMEGAAAIVSSSQYVRLHHAVALGGMPMAKTHVIRLAPPSSEYRSFPSVPEAVFRATYQLFEPYIVFPTVLRLHKNFERLIAAFLRYRQSPDGFASRLRLVFTDDLSNNPKRAEVMHLLHQCRNKEIRGSVRFLGRIPKFHIPSLYQYAAGTIVPTLFEGSCPFPILESLTMGTPAAVSKLEVTMELIQDMEGFLAFNPYSLEEMEAAIRGLWLHRNQLLPRQQSAISQAMQRSWNDVAAEYYALIQHIAAAGG